VEHRGTPRIMTVDALCVRTARGHNRAAKQATHARMRMALVAGINAWSCLRLPCLHNAPPASYALRFVDTYRRRLARLSPHVFCTPPAAARRRMT